jgi:hypothetical protein
VLQRHWQDAVASIAGIYITLLMPVVTPCCQLMLLSSPVCKMHGLHMMHQHTVSHTSSAWVIMTNWANS